ncbi:MAG: prolipoprotein diacylglyceryl transferase [Clostridia bacterium]|nr:prolipoprotein diacylglyceryl transferase [Clostridia bacterium]
MKDITTVSFPGLGIGELNLNKVAFTLFDRIEVRWYGIIITCGIILAFLYAFWRGKKYENVKSDDIIDVGIWTVILGVIGARAYYVLTSLEHYNSFGEAIAIWNGGLAIYGGIIGGCIGILLVCAWKKLSWRKLFDMIAPGVIIAQSLGRWGNFFNGEAYGYRIGETTHYYFFNNAYELPSGEGTFFHWIRMGLYEFGNWVYYHPTFLYESVWNLAGFILINIFYKRKKFDGQIALMYFTWYGFGRMFIEGLRTDSLYIPGTTLRISQCVGLACFVIGGLLLLILSIAKRHSAPVLQTAGAAVAAPRAVEDTAAPQKELSLWERLMEKSLKKHTKANRDEKSHESEE